MKRLGKEITLKRIVGGVQRRISDIPDALAWKLNVQLLRENKTKLISYKNKHLGDRCFIMGNGPSLSRMDLSPLKNEITFGLNRIYIFFEKLDFRPSYFVSVNELVLEQFSEDIKELNMPKFINWNRRKYFNIKDSNTLFVKPSLGLADNFSQDLTKPISSGGTVTYIALQIAFYMGFHEVILIGVDHNFKESGTPNIIEKREATIDSNHFHPDYFPKGSRWQLPDLLRSEMAYNLARIAYEDAGRKIIDATVDGKLSVFPKKDFNTLF